MNFVPLNLLTGESLSSREAARIFRLMFEQKLNRQQAKAILLLLAKKGESADELSGALKALQELEPKHSTRITGLMDTCGTGGDGSRSINVSTLAAFVIAGAGGSVAKHGNRSITSRCGSSDLMEALGVRLDASPKGMVKSIKENGIGYFHAPLYHPVFLRMQPLRKELKTRTIFNLLGPLANPLPIDYRIMGVSKSEYLDLISGVFKKINIKRALVCQSSDGMDEISAGVPSKLIWIERGRLKRETFHPRRFGFKPHKASCYRGGDAKKNASIARRLLKNQLDGSIRDIVVLQSAFGLLVCGLVKNLQQGIGKAEDSIQSGKAWRALEGLRKIS